MGNYGQYLQMVGQGIGTASDSVTTALSAKKQAKEIKKQMQMVGIKLQEELADITKAEESYASSQLAKVGAAGIMSEGSPAEAISETYRRGALAKSRTTFWANQTYAALRRSKKLLLRSALYSSLSSSLQSGFASGSGGGGASSKSSGDTSSILSGGDYASQWGGGAGSGDYSSFSAGGF